MINPKYKKDYAYTKKIIEKHSKTFSIAFSQLKSPKKEAIYSLYAFNRALDDFADEKNDLNGLLEYQELFKRMWLDEEIDDPIFRTMLDVKSNFKLEKAPFEKMFKGQIQDLNFKNIVNEQELIEYCELVAGSVGEMILPILASNYNEQLKVNAIEIGIAMQITNILRDVYEDYQNNRIYLPNDSLVKYQVDLNEVIKHGANDNYIKLWEYYAQMAEAYYQRGLDMLDYYDKDTQDIVYYAIVMYRAILDKVRSNNYQIGKRAILSKTDKLKLMKRH